jgi:hypothetical protein
MNQSEWINVVLRRRVHNELKLLGDANDSFNTIIERVLKEKAPIIKAIKEARSQLVKSSPVSA